MRLLALVLIGALSVVPARADDATAVAKAHFDTARAHYELGRFAEALAEFEKAYEAKPLPKLLFNIGQCHFQEKRYARAVFFYERYLELNPDLADRDVVEALIAEARSLDVEASRAPVAPVAPSVTAPIEPPPPPVTPEEEPPWLAVGAGVSAVVIVTAGVVAWALWTAPPPPGSLGLVDRRAP